MNTPWRTVAHSRYLVEVPEIFVYYDPADLESWKACQARFERSGRKEYSIYGAVCKEFARFAEEGRFLLPYRNSPQKRFVEFRTALLLHRQGFSCWGQVQLFEDERPLFENGKPVWGGKGNAVVNTLRVMKRAGWTWRWPSEIQHTLAFQPRNPDIVAYHTQQRGAWRFCEVKGPGDKCSGDHFTQQLNALAVLHLLTHAPVAIVRPVAEGRTVTSGNTYKARIEYKRGALLDWIRV